jgi:hypothetical protein
VRNPRKVVRKKRAGNSIKKNHEDSLLEYKRIR